MFCVKRRTTLEKFKPGTPGCFSKDGLQRDKVAAGKTGNANREVQRRGGARSGGGENEGAGV